ncbi:MAG: phosphatidylserine decarboxylase [Terriglobales bacterium]|jgi:phosphatidylserine decarboxylase
MVRDGYFYGIGSALAAILIAWLASWPYAIPVILLGAFCLWFFRDPERQIPSDPGAIVSPGDGKVTDVAIVNVGGAPRARISVFLNVFNVHVNRSPIAGVIRDVTYQRGKFLNAMATNSAEENEQNIVTVEGDGRTVVFKQIAGLIARRIVFNLKAGDTVARGQRVGLIKFGSRVDILFDSDAAIQVKLGDHVKGGSSILALLPARQPVDQPVAAGARQEASSWKS